MSLSRASFLRTAALALVAGPAAVRAALCSTQSSGAPVLVPPMTDRVIPFPWKDSAPRRLTRVVGPLQELICIGFTVKHLHDGDASVKVVWRDDQGFAQRRRFLLSSPQTDFPLSGRTFGGVEIEAFGIEALDRQALAVWSQSKDGQSYHTPCRVSWREVTYS